MRNPSPNQILNPKDNIKNLSLNSAPQSLRSDHHQEDGQVAEREALPCSRPLGWDPRTVRLYAYIVRGLGLGFKV